MYVYEKDVVLTKGHECIVRYSLLFTA